MPTDSVPGTAYNRCRICMKPELALCRNNAVEQGCVKVVHLPRTTCLLRSYTIQPLLQPSNLSRIIMAYPTNKRLHLSPRNMDEAHTTYRCTLTPEGAQGHHFGLNIDSEQVDEHSISSHRLVSHTKATPSVTETSTGSTGWQPPAISKAKGGSHWWPWEWLCELLAIGSLGAMVFTLWYYQDRPQADWRQSYFTLNGLIAFLATLTKTGLVIPVSAAIGQRKWLRFLPGGKTKNRARRLGDFETFDEASRGSLGSAKLVISLNALYVDWDSLLWHLLT
jgi:hypothetical protein